MAEEKKFRTSNQSRKKVRRKRSGGLWLLILIPLIIVLGIALGLTVRYILRMWEDKPQQTVSTDTTLPGVSSVTESTTAPESTEETVPGGAGASNENLTDASNAVYVTAIPTMPATDADGTVTLSRGLYNPVVRPLSSVTSSPSSSDPWYLQNIHAGQVHLDGMQTLAYCRMRKLDSDIKRTERQRTVLNILFNKVKTSSIATLNNLLEEILPQVTTDLTKAEILQIAAVVLPYFSSINLELHSIPANGTFAFAMINQQAVLTMNQAQNIEAIRSWLPY